ncbi:hypothetical protein TWF730_003246 [Orbilia blumenaviensis]|uniref:Alpha-ketoglutarate-dependent dioxygenase AlkB-like domain-containing protein n=1 Tax=Orbilia blumenaviensis TaxID=1796055 RepID=A0AAV9U4S3_9PEZI
MKTERKGSRSSRRLQGAPPEPPSPPQSESGEAYMPIQDRGRKVSTQRVSIQTLTGLASPPLSARDPTLDGLPSLGNPELSDGRITRSQSNSVAEQKTVVVETSNSALTRLSGRGSRIEIPSSSIKSVDLGQVEASPAKRGRPSLRQSKQIEGKETKDLPIPLRLPLRGIITKRRSMNPPLISNGSLVADKLEEARQTRAGKRKVENVEVTLTSNGVQVEGSIKAIQGPEPKRQRFDRNYETLVESGSATEAVQATSTLELAKTQPNDKWTTQQVIGLVPEKRKVTARKYSKISQAPMAIATPCKPPAIGKPAVWCDTRQELCESLSSFRSYQGGCYASKGFGRGYLIDGHASERDYMDGSIIISHAGGNSEEVEGERRLVRDQTWDKGVIAYLRNNCDQMVPLIVIIGERCPTAPSRLEHRYSVMDWFKVTHCWPEKDSKSGNIRCKFRLEKLDASERGWWAAADTPRVREDMAIEYINCPGCRQNSPWVYDKEPMCLNKDCKRFWTVHSGRGGKVPEHFVYRKSFLHGRTVWPDAATIAPGSLGPSLPIEDEITESHGRDIKRKFWKGMWCQSCGKLNCRELWKSWKCTNCDYELVPKRSHFIPADLSDQHRPEYTGPPIPENVVDPLIKSGSLVLPDGRRAMIYDVFHCGKIIHILANKTWNALSGGSDWLLDKYQDINMPFKRHELKTHKLTGRLLTQQFSFNSGAPYKYIVEVDSLSFEQSPRVVQQALKILQTDVTLMVPDALPMNEVLNVAYFEEQKMDFHDDGEEDLGPCISSISLGSPAMMYFRVKAKYCNGTLSAADKALLQPSNTLCTDSSSPEPTKRPSKRNILELRLHHGDVIIMNGRPIQRLLEHAVTPEGFRIAATARNISSYNAVINSKDPKTRRTGERRNLQTTGSDEFSTEGVALEPLSQLADVIDSNLAAKAVDTSAVPPLTMPSNSGYVFNEGSTGTLAPQILYQDQEQANKHGLNNLSIPQALISPAIMHRQQSNFYSSQFESPQITGSGSPSVVAPSPTSMLTTPDFRYYNINAASATPIESLRGQDGANTYEEPISPLTIGSAVMGCRFLQPRPDAVPLNGSTDPKAPIEPMTKTTPHAVAGSPQIPGTSLQPQEYVGSEIIDWRKHEGLRAPIPSPMAKANMNGYGYQNLAIGCRSGVQTVAANETVELQGWSHEQFKRLQNMFLSGIDDLHSKDGAA